LSNPFYSKGETFDGFVGQKHLMNKYCFGWTGNTNVAFLQKGTFIKVVMAFVSLLGPECKNLSCHVCGPYPQWMGFDGVSLAMSKSSVLWDTVETIHPKDQYGIPVGADVIKHQYRILLKSRHTRDLLAHFCSATMEEQKFNLLLEKLDKECSSLAVMLRTLYKEELEYSAPLPLFNYAISGIWRDFFLLLSSATSMTWILRPAVIPLLLHLLETKQYTAAIDQELSMFCPPLSYALTRVPEGRVSDALANILAAAIAVVKKTHKQMTFEPTLPGSVYNIPHSIVDDKPVQSSSFQQTSPLQQPWIDHLKTVVAQVKKSHIPLTTSFNPTTLEQKYTIVPEIDSTLSGMVWSFPRIRILPRFNDIDPLPAATDSALQWKELDTPASLAESELFCVKEEKKAYFTQKHTAGLFVGSCLHAVCYGFHCMVAPEGRKDLLKVLYERMPQEVLDEMTVVYDFNCQEGEYMLNRVPEMFTKTRLFIDRFHALSHKCAAAFKLQAYPVFQELISTGPEALNRFLQKFHSQSPFMTQPTYMTLLQTFVGLRNYLINHELKSMLEMYTTVVNK
jgi:hypothetical protein